jgi:hypothetical protein
MGAAPRPLLSDREFHALFGPVHAVLDLARRTLVALGSAARSGCVGPAFLQMVCVGFDCRGLVITAVQLLMRCACYRAAAGYGQALCKLRHHAAGRHGCAHTPAHTV